MRRWVLTSVVCACTGGSGSAVDGPSDVPGMADAPVVVDAAPAGPIDVMGQVVDRFAGPLAGVTVAIGEQRTTSDADGRFVIAGVVPPYDLIAYHADWDRAVLYDDLRRGDPRVVMTPSVIAGNPELDRTASLSGVAMPGFPQLEIAHTEAAIALPQVPRQTTVDGNGGMFGLSDLAWRGPASVTTTVHVLQWYEYMDLPERFIGYGSVSGIVLDPDMPASVDVMLSDLPETDTMVHVTVPEGYEAPQTIVYLSFADGAWLELGWSPFADLSFAAPNLSGARLTIATRSNRDSAYLHGYHDVSPGDEITIELPVGPELLAPADGAVGVGPGTVFSWRPYSGVHSILWHGTAWAGPTVVVHTSASGAAMPDLAAVGASLPSGAVYGWSVFGSTGADDTDALTDPTAPLIPRGIPAGPLTSGDSLSRTFTTPP